MKQRLLARPAFGTGGLLDLTSSFRDLAELWLEDLALQKLSGMVTQQATIMSFIDVFLILTALFSTLIVCAMLIKKPQGMGGGGGGGH